MSALLDRAGVERLLPHRDPFVLVDRLLEVEVGKRAVAEKDVRADQDWARGHFPGNPIFPGVLVAEAMAQTAALAFLAAPDRAGQNVYLVGMDKLRFRKPVRPDCVLRVEVVVTAEKRRIWWFDATASVDGERVATGSFLATIDPPAEAAAAPAAGDAPPPSPARRGDA